jgi:predicted neuraminidase
MSRLANPRSAAFRLCATLALLLLALALDLWQRPARPEAAQALFAAPQNSPEPARLQPQARGHIPMPEGAAAAHASYLLAMPAGDAAVLSAFWFAGDRESAPNVQIAASQFDRVTQQWLPARFVVNRHVMAQQLGFGVRRLGNPVAWLDASGRMHLFVVATGWGGWAAARILHLVQDSAGHSLADLAFRPVRVLPLSWLWNTSFLVRNAPLPLQDGGMLLPAHFEIGLKYPVALRFDRDGEFMGMVRISRQAHMLQPTFLAQTQSHWLALMRDTRNDGHITLAQTGDGGVHWSDLPDLALLNPDAAVAGMALAPERLVLAHNSSPGSRQLLDLSTSADGRQWQLLQPLAHGGAGDEFSYPAMAWADGALWLSYTDHRRSIAWQRWAPAKAQPLLQEGKP